MSRMLVAVVLALSMGGCQLDMWNDPYPASDEGKNILYSVFTERPKHLDPVQSYSENEAVFNAQIYEPPLQYHYFKRPYTLIPQAAAEMPQPQYYDAQGNKLPQETGAKDAAFSVYEIRIKHGVMYQPHPCFAKDANGKPLYQDLKPGALDDIYTLSDFKQTGARELSAADYVYQIKRLAHPRLHSPIFGLLSDYIVGMKEYAATLKQANDELV